MDLITDGWFSEKNPLWPGQYISLKIKNILHHEKSKYQDILVVQTESHGRALILDGIIQCTETDEFSYQEMISMLPLQCHENPSSVLIVGGGDGGVAREVQKHPLVETIHQVEIDERVIALSQKYLPFMSVGFASPKINLHIEDGFLFLKNHSKQFDVIITDSSDPVGPNQSLFQEDYFKLLRTALKPNGVICSQAGAPWLELDSIRRHMDACRKHFSVVKYAVTSIPTYPTGQIGFVVACSEQHQDPSTAKGVQINGLKYYNNAIHSASFVLPESSEAEIRSLGKKIQQLISNLTCICNIVRDVPLSVASHLRDGIVPQETAKDLHRRSTRH